MKDNRGFTLLEMMIVIAITVILICGAYANMNLLKLADAKSCAKLIDVSLDKLRLETMTKWSKKHYLVIEWRETEKKYYLNYVTSASALDVSNWDTACDSIRSKVIAGRNIKIMVTKNANGSDQKVIDSANPCLMIEFLPESGAFFSEWKQIYIYSNTGTTVLHMVSKTGKHYIEEVG